MLRTRARRCLDGLDDTVDAYSYDPLNDTWRGVNHFFAYSRRHHERVEEDVEDSHWRKRELDLPPCAIAHR